MYVRAYLILDKQSPFGGNGRLVNNFFSTRGKNREDMVNTNLSYICAPKSIPRRERRVVISPFSRIKNCERRAH